MPNARLSKLAADRAQPGQSRYVIWDTELPGFGLRVTPSGARTWVIKYRAQGGGRSAPTRWLTLGGYPTLPAEDARKRAKRDLAAVELGQDPASDLVTKRAEMTIRDLIDFYEAEGCVVQRGIRQGEPMKPMTKAYTLARLRHHVVPLLGSRRAKGIVEGDIETFVKNVSAGKTARDEKVQGTDGRSRRIIVRGGAGAARKVVRDLSAVFSFAGRHRIVEFNPVERASVRKTDNKRERFLSLDEIKRLGAALDTLEAEGTNPKAINITRLWALSGFRRNEAAGIKKSEIDLAAGQVVFDDSKTGKSVRPLGAAAVALLDALVKGSPAESDYLFPAERGDGFYVGTKGIWPKVMQRAGLVDVTPQTLRHTIGGTAGSSGEALLMIGAILGHSNARSTAIYAHVSHDPARIAADRITGPIADALAGR